MEKVLKTVRLTVARYALRYRKKYKEVKKENLTLRNYLAEALVKIKLLELREKQLKSMASKMAL